MLSSIDETSSLEFLTTVVLHIKAQPTTKTHVEAKPN